MSQFGNDLSFPMAGISFLFPPEGRPSFYSRDRIVGAISDGEFPFGELL
jgi:hypothetical protein